MPNLVLYTEITEPVCIPHYRYLPSVRRSKGFFGGCFADAGYWPDERGQ